MVFGKTAISVAFLIVSLKLSANSCCDDYECNLIPDQTNCTQAGCFFADGACRDRKCSDGTSTNCEWSNSCKYVGSACVDAKSCSDWSDRESECPSHSDNDGTPCIYAGSACRKAVCGDYNQGDCESSSNKLSCRWATDTCVTLNSCGELNSSNNCVFRDVGDDTCILDGSVCKAFKTCADLTASTTPSCSNLVGVCVFSDGACRFSKCSDYTSSSDCNNGWEAGATDSSHCNWFNSACHVEVCSDYDSSSSDCESSSYLNCMYNSDSKCVPLVCGSYTTGSSCDDAGCYYLSSCPVRDIGGGDDSASGISVPVLLVALLLVLFW